MKENLRGRKGGRWTTVLLVTHWDLGTKQTHTYTHTHTHTHTQKDADTLV